MRSPAPLVLLPDVPARSLALALSNFWARILTCLHPIPLLLTQCSPSRLLGGWPPSNWIFSSIQNADFCIFNFSIILLPANMRVTVMTVLGRMNTVHRGEQLLITPRDLISFQKCCLYPTGFVYTLFKCHWTIKTTASIRTRRSLIHWKAVKISPPSPTQHERTISLLVQGHAVDTF